MTQAHGGSHIPMRQKNNKAPAEIGVIRPRPGLAYDCKTMI